VWSTGITPLIPNLDIFVKIHPVAIYHIITDIRAAAKHNNVFTRLIQFPVFEGSMCNYLKLNNRRKRVISFMDRMLYARRKTHVDPPNGRMGGPQSRS
jgi:hypothetical protein